MFPATVFANESDTLFLVRPNKLVGIAMNLRVSIDGEERGRLKNGSYISIPVSEGTRNVKIYSIFPPYFKNSKFRINVQGKNKYFMVRPNLLGIICNCLGPLISMRYLGVL